MQGDFLMALLRRLLRRRNGKGGGESGGSASGAAAQRQPRLKVVLMSATLDAGLYSAYFGGCPGVWTLFRGLHALICRIFAVLFCVFPPRRGASKHTHAKPAATPPNKYKQCCRARGAPSPWSGCFWRTCTRPRATF
jgi:hypothetical protein